jgi:cyanate permease
MSASELRLLIILVGYGIAFTLAMLAITSRIRRGTLSASRGALLLGIGFSLTPLLAAFSGTARSPIWFSAIEALVIAVTASIALFYLFRRF